mgnify:CR=1 FL=1
MRIIRGFIMQNEWKIIGSKGDEYIIKKTGDHFTCQCLGYHHQERCYHIQMVKDHLATGAPIVSRKEVKLFQGE